MSTRRRTAKVGELSLSGQLFGLQLDPNVKLVKIPNGYTKNSVNVQISRIYAITQNTAEMQIAVSG